LREIGDADRLHAAFSLELGKSLPGLDEGTASRRRPVDQVGVHISEPEPFQAFVAGAQGVVVAVVVVPEFGGDEQIFTPHGRRPDGAADPFLVAVHGGGIDQAVAGLDAPADDAHNLVIADLPDAEPELRDGPGVVHCHDRHSAHMRVPPGARAASATWCSAEDACDVRKIRRRR
jgi:hypothetical protein